MRKIKYAIRDLHEALANAWGKVAAWALTRAYRHAMQAEWIEGPLRALRLDVDEFTSGGRPNGKFSLYGYRGPINAWGNPAPTISKANDNWLESVGIEEDKAEKRARLEREEEE